MMFGDHWMRLIGGVLVDRIARHPAQRASRPRARPFKHRTLGLEMCEDRQMLSGSGIEGTTTDCPTTDCPTTDHGDQNSDSSRQHLASCGSSSGASCSSGSSNGASCSNGNSGGDVAKVSNAISTATSTAPLAAAPLAATALAAAPLAASPSVVTPLTGTPAQNRAFVQHLYKDVLGRTADSAGLTAWTTQLNNGMTTATVGAIFWESVEHRGIQVDSYYQNYLHRASDPAGRQIWVTAMTSGMTEEQIINVFVTSDEYKSANALNNSYVVGLYRDILVRNPDSAGQTAWANALSTGAMTPAQVAQTFIDSHERHVILVDLYYSHLLGRPADTAGETYWAGLLDSGTVKDQDVAEAFLASAEYYTKTTGGTLG